MNTRQTDRSPANVLPCAAFAADHGLAAIDAMNGQDCEGGFLNSLQAITHITRRLMRLLRRITAIIFKRFYQAMGVFDGKKHQGFTSEFKRDLRADRKVTTNDSQPLVRRNVPGPTSNGVWQIDNKADNLDAPEMHQMVRKLHNYAISVQSIIGATQRM